MDEFNPVIAAHKHSGSHREELLESDVCGCFYCMEIYSPQEIQVGWIKVNVHCVRNAELIQLLVRLQITRLLKNF